MLDNPWKSIDCQSESSRSFFKVMLFWCVPTLLMIIWSFFFFFFFFCKRLLRLLRKGWNLPILFINLFHVVCLWQVLGWVSDANICLHSENACLHMHEEEQDLLAFYLVCNWEVSIPRNICGLHKNSPPTLIGEQTLAETVAFRALWFCLGRHRWESNQFTALASCTSWPFIMHTSFLSENKLYFQFLICHYRQLSATYECHVIQWPSLYQTLFKC